MPLRTVVKRINGSFNIHVAFHFLPLFHEFLAFVFPFPCFLGAVFQTSYSAQKLLLLCLKLFLTIYVCLNVFVEPFYGEQLQALIFCVHVDDHPLVYHPLLMNRELHFSYLQDHLLHRNQMMKQFFA